MTETDRDHKQVPTRGRNRPVQRKSVQYTLGALLAGVTVLNLAFGYLVFVGVWRFLLALVPPLVIAGALNAFMLPESWGVPRFTQEYRRWKRSFPPSVRVLTALICGYVVWLPFLVLMLYLYVGLKHLSGLANLRVLRLDDLDITDHGLEHLKALTMLEDLDLFGTEISDAGLVQLRGLKRLKFLGIAETQWEKTGGAITAEAARSLQKYLPDCQIYY